MVDKTQNLRVVAAIADPRHVTLYLESGETIEIKQTDHRLAALMDAIVPVTAKGQVAVVSLSDFSVYAEFERQTQGFAKFFRVAKDKVGGFFGKKLSAPAPEKVQELVGVLSPEAAEDLADALSPAEPPPATAVADVLAHGVPMDTDDDQPISPDETVVALVGEPGQEKAIAGVENLKPLISHAVRSQDPEGLKRFLERCAAIADKRQHSVDDLMRFLEKGDLPLAKDGSIVAYKMLNRKRDKEGYFVDCHTGRVLQRVGSYVTVAESLVDLNRRNECSNGLHIARRGYLTSFSGDVCVVCKIDPEDVMVVPHNDPNKVRVKGYHILGVLSDEAKQNLRQNKAATSNREALQMIHDAINGNHIPRIEEVRVTQQAGHGLQVIDLMVDSVDSHRSNPTPAVAAERIAASAALDDAGNTLGVVNPRDINKAVAKAMAEGDVDPATPDDDVTDPAPVEQGSEPVPEPVPAAISKAQAKRDRKAAKLAKDAAKAKPSKASPPAKKAKPTAKPKPTKPAAPKPEPRKKAQTAPLVPTTKVPAEGKKPQKVVARELFDAKDMKALWAFKKSVKKGWAVLGFNPKEIEKIEKSAP